MNSGVTSKWVTPDAGRPRRTPLATPLEISLAIENADASLSRKTAPASAVVLNSRFALRGDDKATFTTEQNSAISSLKETDNRACRGVAKINATSNRSCYILVAWRSHLRVDWVRLKRNKYLVNDYEESEGVREKEADDRPVNVSQYCDGFPRSVDMYRRLYCILVHQKCREFA
ncbi:hypothetical protein EVAR_35666_1 [Eumeta japonica]|uniref:Uncharacterized protein n=1 Tax=Eumeta variegata TaxID=151549 RepID=A0A4C1VF36_EUMVA|nr:hypothetical protein EVAR_35666_1 [Eumeta japonica]